MVQCHMHTALAVGFITKSVSAPAAAVVVPVVPDALVHCRHWMMVPCCASGCKLYKSSSPIVLVVSAASLPPSEAGGSQSELLTAGRPLIADLRRHSVKKNSALLLHYKEIHNLSYKLQ
jgi:hypothetical protein